MRCLVTGGGGFIGSSIVTKLVEQGHNVVVMGRFSRPHCISAKIIKEVRGIGLLIGLQLYKNNEKFIQKLTNNHLLTIRAADNTIRLLPPLTVNKKEIDLAIKILKKVCISFK